MPGNDCADPTHTCEPIVAPHRSVLARDLNCGMDSGVPRWVILGPGSGTACLLWKSVLKGTRLRSGTLSRYVVLCPLRAHCPCLRFHANYADALKIASYNNA